MMKFGQDEIKRIIPHRDPMLLITEVQDLRPEESICASFYVDPDREIFRGHFPGEPVLPGVYSVECMAQASDILILSMERYANKIPLLIGVDKVKFRKKILPGDTIEIRAEISAEKAEKAIVTCSAKVFNRGELAVEGDVTLAMR